MIDLSPSWIWIALGIGLIALEVVASGLFLFWLGLAALATGLLLFAVGIGVTGQLVVFGVLGLATVLIGRQVQSGQKDTPTDAPFLNERGRALVGKSFTLETAISHGAGSVRVGDTVWRVTGPDMVAGASVVVTAVDGGTLVVKPG